MVFQSYCADCQCRLISTVKVNIFSLIRGIFLFKNFFINLLQFIKWEMNNKADMSVVTAHNSFYYEKVKKKFFIRHYYSNIKNVYKIQL